MSKKRNNIWKTFKFGNRRFWVGEYLSTVEFKYRNNI